MAAIRRPATPQEEPKDGQGVGGRADEEEETGGEAGSEGPHEIVGRGIGGDGVRDQIPTIIGGQGDQQDNGRKHQQPAQQIAPRMPLFLGWRLGTRHAITLGSAQIHPQAAIQTMLTELAAFTATVSAEGLEEAVCNRTSHMRRADANGRGTAWVLFWAVRAMAVILLQS